MNWLTEPGIPTGTQNAPAERARVYLWVFEEYEGSS